MSTVLNDQVEARVQLLNDGLSDSAVYLFALGRDLREVGVEVGVGTSLDNASKVAAGVRAGILCSSLAEANVQNINLFFKSLRKLIYWFIGLFFIVLHRKHMF